MAIGFALYIPELFPTRLRLRDVHPLLADGIASLYPYMPDAWRQRFIRKRAHTAGGGLTLRYAHPNGAVVRDDAKPESGKPGGSDPHFLARYLLDANDISLCVLNSLQTGAFCSMHASADESIVLASAANDYYMDQWLMSGLFEKFPKLRILFVEYGFVWPIPVMLRMDRLWRGLRHEVPWVKKSPIDYVNEHVWFTTQPIEEPRDPRDLERLVKMVGTDNLCFSSDYPHWDNDMPMQSLRLLAKEDRDKILRTNARQVLRLAS